MKILVIDNYDSFVYNLVYILKKEKNCTVTVVKNDQINLNDVNLFDKILLSPGPGIPKNAGLMNDLVNQFAATKNILGVCLGHQSIGEIFNGTLHNLSEPLHGVTSRINVLKNDILFNDIPNHFLIAHYHSWVVHQTKNSDFDVLAINTSNHIMAIKHKTYNVRGLQFHPESILTEYGEKIIQNWVQLT